MARIKYQEAAGLEVKRGRPPTGPAPTKADLVKLYVRERRSVRDVAAVLGCSKEAVHRGLKQDAIDVRSNASRSRLRTISLQDLEAGILTKGIRGTARDLGVNEGTVRHHLKTRRECVSSSSRRLNILQ
jgi:transposase-like protein